MSLPQRAVVFAYHSVGVRALNVLLALGVDVPLVVTHEDDPAENRWFDSVRDLASCARIRCIMPGDPNLSSVIEEVRSCAPDWIFSFYYRRMLEPELLAIPAHGAFNLHGSLLPRYRGRAPVNWAVLRGERETGMSLHRMVEKPDAGALVDQEAVAVLPNDTAHVVFGKLNCAAESLLLRSLPRMLEGRHQEKPLDLASGSYFGARRPEDGRIDWCRSAWEIHNLIRAVAPPYPGAFTEVAGRRLSVLGSWYAGEAALRLGARIYWEGDVCYSDCRDGRRTRLIRLVCDGETLTRQSFVRCFGSDSLDPLLFADDKRVGSPPSTGQGSN